MWSLVRLKNQYKAIFSSELLSKTGNKTKLNVGGLDVTCAVLRKSDNINRLQQGLLKTPEIFRSSSVLLERDDSYGIEFEYGKKSRDSEEIYSHRDSTHVLNNFEAGDSMHISNEFEHSEKRVNSEMIDSGQCSTDVSLNQFDGNLNSICSQEYENLNCSTLVNNNYKPSEHDIIEACGSTNNLNNNSSSFEHTTDSIITLENFGADKNIYNSTNDSVKEQSSRLDSTANNTKNDSVKEQSSRLDSTADNTKNDSDFNLENSTNESKTNEVIISLTQNCQIPVAFDSKGKGKKYFCPFCCTKQQKFGRHLELVHSNEVEVIDLMGYKDRSEDKRDRITLIRNRGMALYNSKPEFNKGELQVPRQQTIGLNKTSASYEMCADCNGLFSYKSIRNHKCVAKLIQQRKNERQEANPKEKSSRIRGRSKFLHCQNNLSDRMRIDILPTFRRSRLQEIICNDEVILQYGEHKCKILPEPHHNNQIKAHMSYAGKLLLCSKKFDPEVTDMKSLLICERYEVVVKAIKEVAGWDKRTSKFSHPNVATMLTTLVKRLAERIEVSTITSKINDDLKEKKIKTIKRFLTYAEKELGADVNKIAINNYAKIRGRKVDKTASDHDVQLFSDYVTTNGRKMYNKLKEIVDAGCFDYETWKSLGEFTLLETLVFNKKRRGEANRITIEDYQNLRKVSPNHPSWQKLSHAEKEQAKIYGRFVITGKLYNVVPVLLHEHLRHSYDLLITTRGQAGVRPGNPFVFGIPNNNPRINKHLDACLLFREHGPRCGAKDPGTLRGTIVRKHLATQLLDDGADDREVSSTSKFMGHSKQIHTGIYQQRVIEDITRVSMRLEKSVGVKKGVKQQEMNDPDTSRNSSDLVSSDGSDTASGAERKRKCSRILSKEEIPKKPRWTSEDTQIICDNFRTAIIKKKAPSNEAMKGIQRLYPSLKSRNINTIRTYITRIMKNPEKFKKFTK